MAQRLETCNFIPASSLGLSEDGWENISNSSNITFGDANRTLYTPDRLLMEVDFSEEDKRLINEAGEEYGGEVQYIDLEN